MIGWQKELASLAEEAQRLGQELQHLRADCLKHPRENLDQTLISEIEKEWEKVLKKAQEQEEIFKNRLRFAQGKPQKERLHLDDILRVKRYEQFKIPLEVEASSFVRGDRLSLINAIENVVENAVVWAPRNKPEQTARVSVNARVEDAFLIITIADDGPGIPEEDRNQIFKLGFSQRRGGTGVGLAETYYALRQHDGEISFESELGKGTTFTIRLPVEKAFIPIQMQEDVLTSL